MNLIKPYRDFDGFWCRQCPDCYRIIKHKIKRKKDSKYYAIKMYNKSRSCKSCIMTGKKSHWYGKLHTEETKSKMSKSAKYRWRSKELRQHMSELTSGRKVSDKTRKKLRDKAANQPRRFGKAVDRGQLELLDKWNKLGFNFEPNYKVHADECLYFIDGYDKEKNVILEYDSKYHNSLRQKQKDLIRQNKIIDIIKPKKFWRYNQKNFIEIIGTPCHE